MVDDSRILPRYGADWIGGIVPAVLRREHPAWMPEVVRGAATVVLLVLDGLGSAIVRRHADSLPTLSGMHGGEVTSVLPSTTAAGLTSIATGAVPARHGLLGYRTRVGGQMINAVKWTTGNAVPVPDPVAAQPVPPFLGQPVPLVNRAEFRDSGFSRAHLRGGVFHGWSTPEELVAGILEAVERAGVNGPRLVYAYDDRVDKAAHGKGLDHAAFADALTVADRVVAAALDRLPGDVALLVTADHGQVAADPARLVRLDDMVSYVAAMGGEARFRTLYAAPGALPTLRERARSYGDVAWVLTREELIDSGWLGGRPGLEMSGRVGDVTLVAKDGFGLLDPTYEQEAGIRSMHGSLSREEMLVPLLAARGRG